jgi:two-component system chemotaxis response regulator CheB
VTQALHPRSQARLATRVIAVVSSAGGIAALSKLFAELPRDLPAAVLVVQHLLASRPSHLAEILGWHTVLSVEEARSGHYPRHGTVYVAPPNAHLVVGADRRLQLSQLPPLHFCRPSGDRLFESLATSFGPRAIAVILTGTGRDGAAGAQILRRNGGTVIVQDPPTAEFLGMPRAALEAGSVDRVLPLEEIAGALHSLAVSGEPV